ncbi:Uncharacterized conserved protein [Anaerobiospirillum thomasii]|uniref:terminase large subunit domain-containing protein n=1 Tax=Anaerobiospirillum thomasii TaxID=179995 RepID=UPI000D96FADF|nr:terminase family protein [Anaerobiospirillum thomasii]SPT71500.1 Uncharacterized conserved protein [Anaerobiospirillum thomasii]
MAELNLEFDFVPRSWQKECMQNQTRFTVLALHRRAGKTTLALAELIMYALKKKGLYVYIAPTLKQASLVAWKPLKQFVQQFMNVDVGGGKKMNFVEVYESDHSVRFMNGSEIRLLGSDNPDSIRGSKISGTIIDEVAQIPNELWTEVVYPALIDSQGWALFIGTPKGINLFSELYFKGQDPQFKPQWSSRKYTVYQTEALNPHDIEMLKRDLDNNTFAREFLCDFNASAEDQLINIDMVNTAMGTDYKPSVLGQYKVFMGCDIARYGNDKTAVCIRRGVKVLDVISWNGASIVETCDRIMNLQNQFKADRMFVDGTGVGGGAVDILRRMNTTLPIFDINFGQRSTLSEYMDKRTEMWFKMAKWLEGGGALPQINELKNELSAPTYIKDDNSKYKLESKKAIKKRLGWSPDLADSIALTFAGYEEEVKASPRQELMSSLMNNANSNPFMRFEDRITHSDREQRLQREFEIMQMLGEL